MSEPAPVYWVHRPQGRLIELRQTRYRERFRLGNEHPHDVCAIARDEQQLRDMVERYNLGPVDWSNE